MYIPIPSSSSIAHIYARCPALIVATIIAGVLITQNPLMSDAFPCKDKSVITFTFDDGYSSQFRYAYPILDIYGYDGVLFPVINEIGTDDRMTYEDLKYLTSKGWEVGSHSMNHEHLTMIDIKGAKDSIFNSKKEFLKNGIVVESFASPYGEYDQNTIRIIKTYYKAHRTVDVGLNNIPLGMNEQYTLKSIVVKSDTTFEEVKVWMDKARDEHKWLILTFHRIGEYGEYNTDIDTFERIVKYAYDNGFVNYI